MIDKTRQGGQDIQSAKRGTKEVTRQQILDTTLQLSATNTVANWVEVNKLVKEKQAAVSQIMLPTKKQAAKGTPEVSRIKKKSVKMAARKKSKPTQKKGKANATKDRPVATLNDITNTYPVEGSKPVQLCGCRHGDLSVLKSFVKSEATYYTRPNRYLEGKGCLDCKCEIAKKRWYSTVMRASKALMPLMMTQ